jgi:uncharacterized repeat protein (TIGR03803 family)
MPTEASRLPLHRAPKRGEISRTKEEPIMRQSVFTVARAAMAALAIAASVLPAAHAATFTVLHQFDDRHGATPIGALAVDAAGNVYGTTSEGGRYGHGTLFQLAPGGFRTLHNFRGGADGAAPVGGLLISADGTRLYGTTSAGGPADAGTVFEMDAGGAYRVLASFDGGAQGRNVQAGLAQDAAGFLYGAAMMGGDPQSGFGTVFRLDPATGQLAILHTFQGDDGAWPVATPLIAGGLLHGTGWGGTVFTLGMDGSGYARLGAGASEDGYIAAGQTADAGGGFWGVAMNGSGSDTGDLFHIDAGQDFSYVFGFDDEDFHVGANPTGTLVLGPDGRLYGTTRRGGPGACRCGTVFGYDTATGQLSTLHAFTGADGAEPWAGLVQDGTGSFYGVTQSGGKHGAGTLFRVTP